MIYKTGDLGRWLPDGTIEFLGRLDRQVKLRGFRIELGEIEALLDQHPAVCASAVIIREDRPGDKRLAAYAVLHSQYQGSEESQQQSSENLVTESELASQLRHFLQERLPQYMTPTAFVILESLPLTPSGKVDRRSLPAPDLGQLPQPKTLCRPCNAN